MLILVHMDKDTFIRVIRMYLRCCDNIRGKHKKIIIAKSLFNFICEYADVMNDPSFINFIPKVFDKLDSLILEEPSFEATKKKLVYKLFHTSNKSYMIYVDNVLKK